MNRRTVIATVLTAAALGLAACSSSASSADESAAATASASMVGGVAACDEASFTQAVEDQLAAEGGKEELFSVDGFECADGWAAVFPTVGDTEENSYTMTMVFEAEGQFWIPKDRMAVCGTQDGGSTARPTDAQVPEAIYQPACNTN